jgi:transposase-like protein
MICPKCKLDTAVKNGNVRGKQRVYCKKCKGNFTIMVKDDLSERIALHLYLEGLTPNWISKLSKKYRTGHSIKRWIKQLGLGFDEIRNQNKERKSVSSVEELPTEIKNILSTNHSKLKSGVLVVGLDIGNPFAYKLHVDESKNDENEVY